MRHIAYINNSQVRTMEINSSMFLHINIVQKVLKYALSYFCRQYVMTS